MNGRHTGERRVDLSTLDKSERQHDPVKEIAGRITKLSFRDMNVLIGVLEKATDRNSVVDPEKLLDACDEVLG